MAGNKLLLSKLPCDLFGKEDAEMNDNRIQETILKKETVYQGILIRLEHWDVALPNGEICKREVACHIGAAAVVALDGDGQIILVRQSRVAVGRITREIPAGKLDAPDEDPLECARRELSEETGLTADHWQKLTVLETTPGFCNERIHLFLATGLHEGSSHPDEDEFVDVVRIPLHTALEQVMQGEFHDGKTCFGILMASQLRHINESYS